MGSAQLHAFPIISANKLNHLFINAQKTTDHLGGKKTPHVEQLPLSQVTGQMLKDAVLYWSRVIMQQKVKGSLDLQFFHNP